MKKNLLNVSLGLALTAGSYSATAQCPTLVNCPTDTIITAAPGTCEATFDYNSPVGVDFCADTILFVSDNTSGTNIPLVLSTAGYTVIEVYSDYSGGDNTALQAGNLDNYAAIYWQAVGTGAGGTHNATTFTNLTTYVNGGGKVFVTGYDIIASPTDPEMYTFFGGTGSQDVPSSGGQGPLLGPECSVTSGLYNTVGLSLAASTGDHDALLGAGGSVFGVHPAGSGFDWAINTIGAGEVAWISSGSSGTFNDWTVVGSGYYEALINFATNATTSSTSMTSGMASGSSFPTGVTTVTYEVVDYTGSNPQTCSFTVTVTESNLPVADATSLTDIVECGTATPVAPTATDTCAGVITGTPDVSFPITTPGLTVVTWTYDDGNGNSITQMQNVTINTVDVNVTTAAATITADATGASYQWLNCDSSYSMIAGETGQSFTPSLTTGNYAVEVTENGCTDTSICTLIDYTSIEEIESIDFVIYPNPNNGEFNIEVNENVNSIQIFDNTGKLVYVSNEVTEGILNIDLTEVERGAYIVKVISNTTSSSKMLIVQ